MNLICHTYIGFQRCTNIHINTNSLPVHPSVPPNLYPFFSQNCLHILSKVFRSTAKQPTQEVGSDILNLQLTTIYVHVTSIKSFDLSTHYTTIPHQKLKDRRLTGIIRNALIFKNGVSRYKYLVLGHEERYTLILKLSTLKLTSSRCLSF